MNFCKYNIKLVIILSLYYFGWYCCQLKGFFLMKSRPTWVMNHLTILNAVSENITNNVLKCYEIPLPYVIELFAQ